MTKNNSKELIERNTEVGFVDSEGKSDERLYFNGNLFRRDFVNKSKRVIDSLNSNETSKMMLLQSKLDRTGCLDLSEVQRDLGDALLEKLRAASLFDVHYVDNPDGSHGFVTKPSAFHKYNDPFTDDAFDLAKALVAALTYGMKQSSADRGQIRMLSALLAKLNRGETVGPATAIGEDYKILEVRGVIRTWRAARYGFFMKLLKRDIGEMALRVLTLGTTAASNALDRPMPGKLTGYSGPEVTRRKLREKQTAASRRITFDVLDALREGGF